MKNYKKRAVSYSIEVKNYNSVNNSVWGQKNLQCIIYVRYRHMAIVFAFDRCFDLKNTTPDQHPERVIFSRCSLMPCPKELHLVL